VSHISIFVVTILVPTTGIEQKYVRHIITCDKNKITSVAHDLLEARNISQASSDDEEKITF